jgi:hypothetical protein
MQSAGSSLPEHLKDFQCMKGARNRAAYRYDDVPLEGNPLTLTITIPAQRMIFLPDNRAFDDYFGGPTIEDCLEDSVSNFPLNPYAQPSVRSCWEDFKDYGYRLQPSFALVFNVQEPILVEEHILPIAPKLTHSNDHVAGGYSLERNHKHGKSRGRSRVVVTDASTMGIEEFLEEAGSEGSLTSRRAFVNGLGKVGELIEVDPQRDQVRLGQDEVLVKLDIDSVIWVTHFLRFRQALKVFVLPHIGDGPLINHNNHVYVDVLLPRSNHDRNANAGRSEWWTQPFPISAIPHTHFAQMSSGAGSLNIYVMFPRMIHKNGRTGRRETVIPYEVQSMWLSDIVLPALVQATDRAFHPYVDFTLEEWKWKASKDQGFSNTKSVPIQDAQLEALQNAMRKIIRDSPHDLDLFGSFFFVADIRGCKGITRGDDPYERLKKEYAGMDWDYAMKRENGQLVLDLGITFQPNATNKTPLVGLWRFDVMQPSYAKAGATKPTLHPTCTMQRYGSLQATMGQRRSRAVQLRFLSSYMLSFEPIRRPSVKHYFCKDTDAYATSTEFHASCNKYIEIYQGSRAKSFGVRHEIRASGVAVTAALKFATTKVGMSIILTHLLYVSSVSNHNVHQPRRLRSYVLSQFCGSHRTYGSHSWEGELMKFGMLR